MLAVRRLVDRLEIEPQLQAAGRFPPDSGGQERAGR
jgi:hypothetical protein